MKRLEQQEVKQILFEILYDFSKFCDENSLRYYLSGGTLLGAIRHKGFIPWDDDIDVLMPRPDYDRMHKILKQKDIKPYYKLLSIQAENSSWPFAKIVNIKTYTKNEYINDSIGLWIDIFPMDGLPKSKKESYKILSKAKHLKKWLIRCHGKIGTGKNVPRAILKIPMLLIFKICKLERSLGHKLDKIAQQYDFNSSNYIAGIAWSLGFNERMKKADYLPVEDVEFCGNMFHAPACWDYYLTSIYGDYMKFPPKEQRKGHNILAFIKK